MKIEMMAREVAGIRRVVFEENGSGHIELYITHRKPITHRQWRDWLTRIVEASGGEMDKFDRWTEQEGGWQ